ncbi:hypothetical protein [Motilibacter deserti]|uniref:CARDB protein n=1 Tax=Motilibacter deserti TaxID=2714956 RepID=A0ABX0GSD9_9ACTN|nr:hypothetical protein [Motilibacter deserti]NHC13796.1 hypothetical protein [Motilibacter deserti]
MGRRVLSSIGAVGAVLLIVLLPPPATAADADVGVGATLDSRTTNAIDSNDPLDLRPERELAVTVEVENRGTTPIEIRSVRLEGKVIGLTFFEYSTRIDLQVAPGATETSDFSVDVGDLRGQATGLLPATLELVDADRNVVSSVDVPVDVKGSLRSVYGIFGLIIALVTLLLLIPALVRLALRALPENRWYRAVRFAIPGMGVGLTCAFTLSAMRVLMPDATASLTLVLVGGLVGLVLGFLTPGPRKDQPARHTIDLDAAARAGEPATASTITLPSPSGEPASSRGPDIEKQARTS